MTKRARLVGSTPAVYRSRSAIWVLPFALVMLASGCLPFAWVAPPMTLEAGVGASVPEEGKPTVAVPLRAVATPLAANEKFHERYLDLGVGYQFIPHIDRQNLHGPLVEGGLLIPMGYHGEMLWRIAALMRGHMLTAPGRRLGVGAGLQVRSEWAQFGSGPFEGCSDDADDPTFAPQEPYEDYDTDFSCASGRTHGEGGVGISLELAFVDVDQEVFQYVGLGLVIRIPASFGVGFAFVGWGD